MGYRIDYSCPTIRQNTTYHAKGAVLPMTAVFLAMFILLVHFFWPQGRQVLRELIIPGDADTTVHAVTTFVAELRYGNSFSGAAEVFCREILNHAGIH